MLWEMSALVLAYVHSPYAPPSGLVRRYEISSLFQDIRPTTPETQTGLNHDGGGPRGVKKEIPVVLAPSHVCHKIAE